MIIEPVLSICCITYNHEKYIGKCLESFISQKVSFPIEIVISNDCSTDNTQEIINDFKERYPALIRDVSPSKNLGAINNFYYALSQCKGKYIAYCEGDDYWIDENKSQMQVDFLENNLEYGLCYTLSKKFSQNKKTFMRSSFGKSCCSYKDLLYADLIPTQTICFRSSDYHEYIANVHPEDRNWRMGDLPLLLWFSIKSKIFYYPFITSVYRVLSSSVNHQGSFQAGQIFLESSYDIKKFYVESFSLDYKKEELENRYNYNLFTKAFILNDYNSFKEYYYKYAGKLTLIKSIGFYLMVKLKVFFICVRFFYGISHV